MSVELIWEVNLISWGAEGRSPVAPILVQLATRFQSNFQIAFIYSEAQNQNCIDAVQFCTQTV